MQMDINVRAQDLLSLDLNFTLAACEIDPVYWLLRGTDGSETNEIIESRVTYADTITDERSRILVKLILQLHQKILNIFCKEV
jgi:hypothetical protein